MECKKKFIYFLNACYWSSYEWFINACVVLFLHSFGIIIYLIFFYLFFYINVITRTSGEMTEYSLMANGNNLVHINSIPFLQSTWSPHSANLLSFNHQPMLSITSLLCFFFINRPLHIAKIYHYFHCYFKF